MNIVNARPSIINVSNLRSVNYYIIINDSTIDFVKLIGKNKHKIIDSYKYKAFTDDLISKYFTRLVSQNYLFGQPIEIIINLASTFTYIKQIGSSHLSEIQESVKFLSNKEYDTKYSICDIGDSKLFVYQAINKVVIESLLRAIEKHNVLLLKIYSLPIALLNQIAISDEKDSVHSFSFFNHKYHYIKNNNSILFMPDVALNHKELSDIFSSEKGYNSFSKTSSESILYNSSKTKYDNLSYFSNNSKKVWYMKTAHNSLKLLSRIVILLLIIVIFTTGISSLMSSNSQIISDYQKSYTEKQNIQNQIDSLNTIVLKANQERPETINSAAILSLFCQKSYNNLYLSNILINNKIDDSIVVETKGYAKNEDLIFKYQNALHQYMTPYQLTLNIIKPEYINNRGLVDTTITFIFSMVINK